MPSSTYRLIVETIGDDAARTLIERLGGMQVYVPVCPNAQSPLVLAIGHGKAARMCDLFGGQVLQLPARSKVTLKRRISDIEYDLRRGLSCSEIANRHGITYRRVLQIKQALS